MPSGVSNYASQSWLPLLFGIGATPAAYYVGLTSQPPLASYDGTAVMAIEPQGGAYSREVLGVGASWWDNSNGVISNHGNVVYTTPTADWGYLTHYILCSAAGAGNLYCWGELRNPQKVVQGVPVSILAGTIVMTMPGG
jgi:hypothetical protein